MRKKLQPLKLPSRLSLKASLWIIGLGLGSGLLLLLLAGSDMDGHGTIGALNQPVLDWFVEHRTSPITVVMTLVASVLQPPVVILIGTLLAVLWAIRRKELWRPLLLFGSFGLAASSVLLLKVLTKNARPDESLQLPPFEPSFSFPSAHTLILMIACLAALYLIYSRSRKRYHAWLWSLVTLFVVGVISLNRLYLAAHWLTDIVGAVGLGLIVLAVMVALDLAYTKIARFERSTRG